MKRDLEEKLRRSYPQLFRELYRDPNLTGMGQGIECEDGWFELINQLSLDTMAELKQQPDPEFHFTQIKNRSGRLVVDLSDQWNKQIQELAKKTKNQSMTVCEICGADDAEYQEPWYSCCVTCDGTWKKISSISSHPLNTESNRQQNLHCEIVYASQLLTPETNVTATIKSRIETRKASWSESTSLRMPVEKLNLLVAITRHMTDCYNRTDLFEDWAYRLVSREELGSTGSLRIGLAHQFQSRKELSAAKQKVDWWAFLFPDGTDYEALDREPAYIVIVPIFGKDGLEKELESWATAGRLGGHLDPKEVARSEAKRATEWLNFALDGSLQQVRDQCARYRESKSGI